MIFAQTGSSHKALGRGLRQAHCVQFSSLKDRITAAMLPRINHHFHTARGGQDLSKRFSHTPNVSKASGPFVDAKSSNLSSQGLASDITVAAASRLVRDGKECTLFYGVKVPKKPTPPAADGE